MDEKIILFKKLLVAMDDSALAARACEAGSKLAAAFNAELAFVYVIDPGLAPVPDSILSVQKSIAEQKAHAENTIQGIVSQLQLKEMPLRFIPVGKPAEEIAKAGQEWKADIIVIGSHGRTGIKRLLLGSVAESVMHHAHCPVLVVKS